MTSTIKVNTITTESGSTLTVGGCGKTVALASGASQSGFGRTGTVDWVTTPKTGDFTAANGEGYFVDTSSGAITMTLPASPAAGNIVAFKDYAGTFNGNNFTIARNGSNLSGNNTDKVINTVNEGMTLVYVDSTKGWIPAQQGTGNIGESFIQATGGDAVVTCGNFKTHIFTSPGTFCVALTASATPDNNVDYFVVAGGAGGGSNSSSAGGGAGGFRVSNSVGSIPAPTMSPLANPSGLPVSIQGYPITVGGGGNAAPGPGPISCNGSNSIFSSITSAGGGGAKSQPNGVGIAGGSGGGGKGAPSFPGAGFPGGSGNTPPVSPPQGNNGGAGWDGISANTQGGGGGGAGAVGGNASSGAGGLGGAGSFLADAFIGPTAPSYGEPGPVSSTRYFAGGGGGAADSPNANPFAGGVGGGGNGGNPGTPVAERGGVANTGGGAGGGDPSANGGSGIVMIRYKFQ